MHRSIVELDLLPQILVYQLADARRPVGKVDERRLAAALAQPLGEELALRALAGAVDALEDDEGATRRRLQAATADMVKKRLKIVLAAAQSRACARSKTVKPRLPLRLKQVEIRCPTGCRS